MFNNVFCRIDLQLFAEGSAPAGDGGTGVQAVTPAAENAESESVEGASQPQQSRAELYRSFKDEYKNEFNSEVQAIINDRLKNVNKKHSEETAKQRELISVIAQKYGVDSNDIDKIQKAVYDDNSFYEDEALEKGISVEQLKYMKSIERENAQFKQAAAERERIEGAQKVFQNWINQGERIKEEYDPGFSVQTEYDSNPEFARLLNVGIDAKTAYEVTHRSELNKKAMEMAARKTEEAVVNKIKANGMRPNENGVSDMSGGSDFNVDPSKLTKEQRADYKKRIMRGEKISF